MRTSVFYIAITFVIFFLLPVEAQEYHRFNISAGAGVSVPTSDASANLNTGWNMNFRGGINVTQSFLADLDFTYNRWDLSDLALARAGQPGGYADVWSFSFEPMIRLARVFWQTGDATLIDGVPNGLAELAVDGSRRRIPRSSCRE